jgi:hypothetical protein
MIDFDRIVVLVVWLAVGITVPLFIKWVDKIKDRYRDKILLVKVAMLLAVMTWILTNTMFMCGVVLEVIATELIDMREGGTALATHPLLLVAYFVVALLNIRALGEMLPRMKSIATMKEKGNEGRQ